MPDRRALLALALTLAAGAAALADAWEQSEVSAAAQWQQEEVMRARAYRERVARGDLRAEAAPRPRSAPELPGPEPEPPPSAPTPRELVELLEQIFGPVAEPAPDREGRPVAPRSARPRAPSADDWWAEEERRLEHAQ